ncbi:hypothetical protein BT96DRAFT_943119 [Gymnopus androsaceus JB14]|uniref:Uncharacterized protein n=1 Tax=Gymnopus androsaceus JB14 TaxID=1447944 RepID=A0A6A4HAW7_9AGAR|nr:hypothetical protein BT96DRAFT_943119 [Gymnopus androsaceus JB14]
MAPMTISQGRGIYGLMQLGHKIKNAPSFGEGSDGTTSLSHCMNLKDQSTWKPVMRFADVAPALDYTAQCQFEGSVELGEQIANTYSNSPLASRDRQKMDADDYFRKQAFLSILHPENPALTPTVLFITPLILFTAHTLLLTVHIELTTVPPMLVTAYILLLTVPVPLSTVYSLLLPIHGNGAKLSSAGLWLNASKPEFMLETMILVLHMLLELR